MDSRNMEALKLPLIQLFPCHLEYLEKNIFSVFLPFDETLIHIMEDLDKYITNGLSETPQSKLFPSYISQLPDGSECGTYLAIDLGGSHVRVLVVNINGRITDAKIYQEDLPVDVTHGPGYQLFDYIAARLHKLLKECSLLNTNKTISLGFTFSYRIYITGLNRATLQSWAKNIDCPDVINEDVGQCLQDAITRKGEMNVRCVAIINDTIGTLMSGALLDNNCAVGLICGTGTNGCCLEASVNIADLKGVANLPEKIAVDTRWCCFGDHCQVDRYRSEYDLEIEQETHCCSQKFERTMCGLSLGEIVRIVMHKLHVDGICFETWTQMLDKPFGLHTNELADIVNEDDQSIARIEGILQRFEVLNPSTTDCKVLKEICTLVVVRAAFYTAACTACLVNRVNRRIVGIAVDGSVFKGIPLFRDKILEKMQTLVHPDIKFYFTPCNDGSGLGAAIVAAIEERQHMKSL